MESIFCHSISENLVTRRKKANDLWHNFLSSDALKRNVRLVAPAGVWGHIDYIVPKNLYKCMHTCSVKAYPVWGDTRE